ncbi:MAG: HTTM domain-containing protein [bacterium]|nr:HTTM domain-containing protein [Candidatus Kapabacteria bacterium]
MATRELDKNRRGDVDRWLDWYRIVVATGLAATIALTYRLWISSRDFPLTPVVDSLPAIPSPYDHILVVVLLIGLIGAAALRNPRPAIVIAIIVAIVLCLLDQSRWQPYFVQFMAMIAALALVPWRRVKELTPERVHWALAPARLLLVFTYVFAGLQKMNYDFAEWLFLWFLGPFLRNVGIGTDGIDPTLISIIAFVAAAFELTCGLLLVFARTRVAGLIGLTALHVLIMIAIGPFGHNDNLAVWPWNIAQIAILWILLFKIDPDVPTLPRFFSGQWWNSLFGGGAWIAPTIGQRTATMAALVLFGVLPVFGFFGMWDSYLSFALYSGNTYDALFLVDPADVAKMPGSARRAVRSDGTLDPFAWSLDDTHTTMYPEKRILESIGMSLARHAELGDVFLRFTEPPNRFTGERVARNLRFPKGGAKPEEIELPTQAGAPASP